MKQYTPLQDGDEIRVVAPSQSGNVQTSSALRKAVKRIESFGYKISYGKYNADVLHFNTASANLRAKDLMDAFQDPNVKAILSINGGWSANEVLPLLDWNVIAKNPKPIIGYSDNTVLHNAVYAKTGQIGLLGPNLGTLRYQLGWRYMASNLDTMLRKKLPYELPRSKKWNQWGNERGRKTRWRKLRSGQAEGILLGGNLGSLFLLQGTEYMPKFDQPFILAAEDDSEAGSATGMEFSRRLESLLQQPGFRDNLCGMIIGRFDDGACVKVTDVVSILDAKNLGNIPIAANMDFGHTRPMFTLPIGGMAKLEVNDKIKCEILEI